jgi:MAP kinase interacting serine/threonine kinase
LEDENNVGTSIGNKENSGYSEENNAEDYDRAISIAALTARKEEAKTRRKKKKKTASSTSLASNTFQELYRLTGEVLGQGAYASVQTCVNIYTEVEYAVKIIDKLPTHSRARVFKEIDLFHHCQGHPNIIQLIEYFEETERFYLIFEKVSGGQLLDHIQTRKYFTEREAANIIRDVASALEFLHSKGIAHRDLKPENVLCVYRDRLTPVKLCDFDLGSTPLFHSGGGTDTTPLLLTPVGSAEFMAPEIVEAFIEDTEEDFKYDKRCDLWSLGVMMYILLSGYPPFSGSCGHQCAWAAGGACDLCQLNLFNNIQQGKFEFHTKEWSAVSGPAKDLIRKLLVKDAQKRLSARDVLYHEWLDNNNQAALVTPAKIRKDNSAKTLSLACESVSVVNRVVLQHMSINNINIMDTSSDNLVGLSPPSDSMMMQRRKSLQKGQSLQLNRMNNNTTELTTPAKIRKNNSVKELTMFAESAAAVNRVVLQHMSINIWPINGDNTADTDMQCNVAGLSPPSESRMLQRRKSLQKGKSLQLNRFSSNSKVLSIQDLIGPVPIASPSC